MQITITISDTQVFYSDEAYLGIEFVTGSNGLRSYASERIAKELIQSVGYPRAVLRQLEKTIVESIEKYFEDEHG